MNRRKGERERDRLLSGADAAVAGGGGEKQEGGEREGRERERGPLSNGAEENKETDSFHPLLFPRASIGDEMLR